MPVQQRRAARHWRQRQLEPPGRALAIDKFLQELGALRERLCRGARQHCRELIAQGQQAGGLQPDDRCTGRDVRRECVQHTLRLMQCLVDEARSFTCRGRARESGVVGGDTLRERESSHPVGGLSSLLIRSLLRSALRLQGLSSPRRSSPVTHALVPVREPPPARVGFYLESVGSRADP